LARRGPVTVAAGFAGCGTDRLGLYPVVDSVDWLEKLPPLGVRTIQLRVKGCSESEADGMTRRAVAIGRRYGARMFINDYWPAAVRHGAYGVHLGQEDLDAADLAQIKNAGLRLGISTHSETEWRRAAALQPSYIALGTVFPTTTKPAVVIGVEKLNQWVSALKNKFPLVAIGGIKRHNLHQVLASGVGSVAVASAITGAEDYREEVAWFMDEIG